MPRSPLPRILLILLLLALLPALFFTAYELNTLSDNEELIGSIYRQQLDAILFSVNQHAWDVASAWAGTVSAALREGAGTDSALALLFPRIPSVRALLLADTAAVRVRMVGRDAGSTAGLPGGPPDARLRADAPLLERLVRYARASYRKLEPVVLSDTASGDPVVLLLFASGAPRPEDAIAGMVIDGREFVNISLASKLREAAESGFLVAVLRKEGGETVFATGGGAPEGYRQRKGLWLFPTYDLGIALRSGSIEELARRRSNRNLLLIGLVDLVLLAGIWLVYRTIKREMDFVRMKSDFVSNVSHELRTPLALIRMFGETLAMNRVPTEERKQEYYRTIVQETERLSHLVNTILNFSRMEAGRKRYDFRPTLLNEVVQRVADTYGPRLEEGSFDAAVELAPGLPPLEADAEAVTEAVINVLDNAMKYSPAGGEIRIATGAADGMQYVEVRDHGTGIAPEHHRKIFETFYRVSGGAVHNTKGTGLGLAIVKHIVDAHGGRIDLTSAPGAGSTFRLLFPVRHGAQ